MKRASYREAIAWIAANDGAGDDEALDPVHCSEIVSAVLVADLFDVPNEKVGADIVRARQQERGYSIAAPTVGPGCFRSVAVELIYGDGTDDSMQRTIDLARVALALEPGTRSLDGYVPPQDRSRARS